MEKEMNKFHNIQKYKAFLMLSITTALIAESLACASFTHATIITYTPTLTIETSLPSSTMTETVVAPTVTNTLLATRTVMPTNTIIANRWTFIGPEKVFISAIAIDPLQPTNIFAGGIYGLYRSTNGGLDWDLQNKGLNRSSEIWSLAIDPETPTTIYAGTVKGVYKSTNGGDEWISANVGIPEGYFVNTFAIDPLNPSTLYAGATYYFCGGSCSTGIALKSTNGGTDWHEIKSNMKDNGQVSIVIDPITPTTLYIGIYGGMYKSTNSGDNWYLSNSGLTNTNILSLVIDPVNPTNLYAGTGGGEHSGIYKSTDSGVTWRLISYDLKNSNPIIVMCIAVDPLTPANVYVSLAESVDIRTKPLGVITSINGGESWNEFNNGLPENERVDVIAIDPIISTTIYAAPSEGIYIIHKVQ
jgi:photosystem II stability/assembly factor-like uncharacterized protein